ncbi:MAG: undecaprenyldiphospho-muramoylpentapeptide beta-N-acetylglucosaminyltransferase [Candidatus Eremiobacteraeota bacterium]|nr:undecaprenyldiphospho-muramoylpentapeptide beta-N-acetylglucosaminyltransferase [Candidatus Eremiobacteraeota bacterium]
MTVVFAGGGTGGHLYPAIAIADALRDRASIAFVGTANRLERSIVPNAGYPLYTIAAHHLPRRPTPELLKTALANLWGTLQSLRVLARLRPDIIVATGGYVCFPVAVAARVRRLFERKGPPVVLLEPNAAPGLTNRLLAPFVDETWHEVPIRASLHHLPPRELAARRLGLDASLRCVLVLGGSQGARTINDAVVEIARTNAIPEGWQVLHVTGQRDYARVAARLQAPGRSAQRYAVHDYLNDMADAYACADLVVTRAGASTLGELRFLGKPAILVPYPFSAEGHQTANAQRLQRAGAALVLEDAALSAGDLAAALACVTPPQRLDQMTLQAKQMQGSDPIATILVRIDTLVARRNRGELSAL